MPSIDAELNYPLRFQPVFMERLWGGRRLESELGKPIPTGRQIGESWEICHHTQATSLVTNGPLSGKSLAKLVLEAPAALLGSRHSYPRQTGQTFPLLIKWIDAAQTLSIQVHPKDGHPRLPPGELGKTECWLIANADRDARIYLGLRAGTDRRSWMEAIAQGTVEHCLNVFAVHPGDFFFVPAGTPHAIGAGILLAEIQQTSDTTFRLWDWNRTDPNTGQARTLHIEQALDSIDFTNTSFRHVPRQTPAPTGTHTLLGPDQCSHFSVARRSFTKDQMVGESDRFHILICLSGQAHVGFEGQTVAIARGDVVLLPACGPFPCRAAPEVELLDTWQPF